MNKPMWFEHESRAAMADAVASRVDAIIRGAQRARGTAILAMPGGRSPAPALERLSAMTVDWSKVTLLPTDERLVRHDDPLSNAAQLARHFAGSAAQLVPLIRDADVDADYRTAGHNADDLLQRLAWPLDMVWLGMGADGHTASLFPGPDLERALAENTRRRAVGVLPEPLPAEAPVARVTLTGAAIASARCLLLTVSGSEKRGVLEGALEAESTSTLPIARVLARARTPIEIHWSPT